MKKLLTLLLLATLLLTACASPNPPLDNETTEAPTDAESTTPDDTELTTVPNETTTPEDIETTTPEDVETTTPEESETTGVIVCGPGPFSDDDTIYIENTTDFYTLLKTKSTNPDDYEAPMRKLVNCVNQIPEVNVLITLEDFGIKNQELLDKLSGVELGFKTKYSGNYYLYQYLFENDSIIKVYYDPEEFAGINGSNLYTITGPRAKINEGGFLAWCADLKSVNQNLWVDNVYWEEIDGCLVYYFSYTYKPGIRKDSVCILIGGFCITVSYRADVINDDDTTDYSDLLQYFSEDTYQDAVRQLIEVIENRG